MVTKLLLSCSLLIKNYMYMHSRCIFNYYAFSIITSHTESKQSQNNNFISLKVCLWNTDVQATTVKKVAQRSRSMPTSQGHWPQCHGERGKHAAHGLTDQWSTPVQNLHYSQIYIQYYKYFPISRDFCTKLDYFAQSWQILSLFSLAS